MATGSPSCWAIIGRPNVGKSTLLNALTGTARAIVSPIAGTTRDAVDEVVTRGSHDFRFVDTAGIRRKGKTRLMAEKLSVIMARKHLEAADVSLLVLDATEGVTALDANIGGYAHESGRSVILVVNKWDLVTHPPTGHPERTFQRSQHQPPRPSFGQRPVLAVRLPRVGSNLEPHPSPPRPESSSSSKSATTSSSSTTPHSSSSPPPPASASRSSSAKSNSSPASAASASPPAR
jgi:small GTP-binding protein